VLDNATDDKTWIFILDVLAGWANSTNGVVTGWNSVLDRVAALIAEIDHKNTFSVVGQNRAVYFWPGLRILSFFLCNAASAVATIGATI